MRWMQDMRARLDEGLPYFDSLYSSAGFRLEDWHSGPQSRLAVPGSGCRSLMLWTPLPDEVAIGLLDVFEASQPA